MTAESLNVKAITRDEETGAVLYNPKVKVKAADAKAIRESCPWDIPRWDKKTREWLNAPCVLTGLKKGCYRHVLKPVLQAL